MTRWSKRPKAKACAHGFINSHLAAIGLSVTTLVTFPTLLFQVAAAPRGQSKQPRSLAA